MNVKGRIRIDKKTKNLVKRLNPGEIAIIDHKDLDEVAAQSLIAARVKAVINLGPSITGRYPNQGPLRLVNNGILLMDADSRRISSQLKEGQEIEIKGCRIYAHSNLIAHGTILTPKMVKKRLADSLENYQQGLKIFAENTLRYAAQELDLLVKDLSDPLLRTDFENRHALVVVRGHNYREDLKAVDTYIREMHPVLIGVDGGADALLEVGLRPDLIIGDMDSVTDKALRCGAELVVHAYANGIAPGMDRLGKLGLSARTIPSQGTSEDIAMLLAYQKGAELIVAVGSHSNVLDFLEKGRPGMASTLLTRMKIGPNLVDAKGVSRLYRQRMRVSYVAQIVVAAMIPFTLIAVVAPETFQLIRLLLIRLKLLFNF